MASVAAAAGPRLHSGDQRNCVVFGEGLKMWPVEGESTEIKPSLHHSTDKWWGEETEEGRLASQALTPESGRHQISLWEGRKKDSAKEEGDRQQRSLRATSGTFTRAWRAMHSHTLAPRPVQWQACAQNLMAELNWGKTFVSFILLVCLISHWQIPRETRTYPHLSSLMETCTATVKSVTRLADRLKINQQIIALFFFFFKCSNRNQLMSPVHPCVLFLDISTFRPLRRKKGFFHLNKTGFSVFNENFLSSSKTTHLLKLQISSILQLLAQF